MEWLTISIRYIQLDQDNSELISAVVDGSTYTAEMPQNLTFASSVAAFGIRYTILAKGGHYGIIVMILKNRSKYHVYCRLIK
jgi:hypothetical protein